MKFLFTFFWKLRGSRFERNAKNKISKLGGGEYRLNFKIPYVSQYASKEFAARYIENDEHLREDSKWRDSGAETIDEYVFWAPKLCGMACFSMVLRALVAAELPVSKLVKLSKKAMEAGCYVRHRVSKKQGLVGMLHAPFLKFAESYGLHGKLLWYIGPNVVAKEILQNNFVIASVSNQIRNRGARPADQTGHLVLVHGFEVRNGKISGFFIHNPSGFFNESQENHFVPIGDFANCFSGRFISLWKK